MIEIFLPLQRNDGSPQPPGSFSEVREALVTKFGALTAYTRAPAEGFWQREEGIVDRDSIVILEVVAENLERAWWRAFRERLENLFQQDAILIRSFAVVSL